MKDDRPVSKAMITKLLKANGLKVKLSEWVKASVMLNSTPFLSVLTEEEREEIVEKHLENEAMEMFAKVYGEHYTVEEVLDMLAFFKSPLYQKMLDVQLDVAMQMADAVQLVSSQVSLKVIKECLKKSLENTDEDEDLIDLP